MLGVTVDTIRRWADDDRLRTVRSAGGQRLVPIEEVTRLIGERRRASTDRPIVAQSARNRFAGIVTRIEKDRVAAVVEILAGPHRLVSLMTAEAIGSGVTVNRRLAVTLAGLAILVMACTAGPARSSPSVDSLPLTVFGAASLKGALDRVKPAWEAAHPGSVLTISTDSSAALETQIEQGAPADVLLSADTSNPNKLVGEGLADGNPVSFAGNVLTIVVPADNPARIASPADLARRGLKIIAAGDDVPITTYALRVVANLAKSIELGEGDAGIVYATDAKASAKVATIAIPAEANVPATYAGVVVKSSAHSATAHALLSWLAGPDGQAILASFGFQPPPAG